MYYVCIENNQVISVLNYEPSVPNTVDIVSISDEDYQKLQSETHVFNPNTKTLVSQNPAILAQKEQEKLNAVEREFLNSTDWKVMRHIRQKALGIPTSLTEEQYLELEQQRQAAAARIV